MLDELSLKDSYSSDADDIVKDFYVPILEHAVSYDRITGYFSPSILAVAARGFAGLIKNNGKIRILSSIQVSHDTFKAIQESADLSIDENIFKKINFNAELIKDELQKDYLRVFMCLYNSGALELKIAVLNDSSGILHQKVGIVKDTAGNAISFSGSNNETIGGIINNLEEFKVFKNWTISSSSYFANDESKFNKYWNNEVKNVIVMNINEAVKRELVRVVDTNEDINHILERIQFKEQEIAKPNCGAVESDRSLRDYQVKAIDHWVGHDYKSIFEMATGTGKTFTAINALKRFRDNNKYLRAIVVVPLTTLTIQWNDDIKKVIPDVSIINTSINKKWREELNNLIISRELGKDINFIIITTYSMFSKEDFGEKISGLGKDTILLADEMHNLVNKNRIAALVNPCYKYKLGLSATPTRLWQQAESAIARLHFGGNDYQYSLSDAIKNGFLVPYNYHPLPINLTIDEYEDYVNLSREIARMSQMNSDKSDENTALNMKLIARSRIKKNAENKILSLQTTLRKMQKDGSLYDALIYVDNEDFLQNIQIMLTDNNIRTTKFTGSSTLEDRLSAIDNLRRHSINAIVAIKCLDEGVDIPSAKVAFFISNNTDPREYVQRLGRVLRLDKVSGKDHSDIYDYLVMPPSDVVYENEMDRRIARNMIKNELIRSKFFNELSTNTEQAQEIIDDTVDEFGFYFKKDELTYNIGVEDD